MREFNGTQKISPQQLMEYFVHLFRNEEEADNTSRNQFEILADSIEVLIKMDETEDELKELRNRETPGQDKLSNELLKYGGTKLHKHIKI